MTIISRFIRTFYKFFYKNNLKYLFSNFAPIRAPNSVGVGVTQRRRYLSHLGATETIHHGTDLFAVLDFKIFVLSELHQMGKQPKSPLFIIWHTFDW